MELKAEWEHRIQNWMRVLAKDLYRPLGDMTFEARPTMSRLDLQTAMQGEFQPIKAGDAWGQEWESLAAQPNYLAGGSRRRTHCDEP